MRLSAHRYGKKATVVCAALLMGQVLEAGCLDSSIALRFREAYAPGLVAGLSTAISNPADSETGFRQAGAALFEGLGAILLPRPGDTDSSGK
jgi:hypothetical protein